MSTTVVDGMIYPARHRGSPAAHEPHVVPSRTSAPMTIVRLKFLRSALHYCTASQTASRYLYPSHSASSTSAPPGKSHLPPRGGGTINNNKSPNMDIRLLHPSDIPHVQHANITNLPEKYVQRQWQFLPYSLSRKHTTYLLVLVCPFNSFSLSFAPLIKPPKNKRDRESRIERLTSTPFSPIATS